MADELVDIFDDNYHHVGSRMKSDARKEGLWLHAFHCWIVRSNGSNGVLQLQKRGRDKKVFPNALDISAAGHLLSGEKPIDGIREIEEELGIKVLPENLKYTGIKFDIGSAGKNIIREFCHTYMYESKLRPNEYLLQLDEVDGIVEIDLEDGLRLFSNQVSKVKAEGVELDRNSMTYEPVELFVTKDLFIPRNDSYYYKAFINAKDYLNGRDHISF